MQDRESLIDMAIRLFSKRGLTLREAGSDIQDGGNLVYPLYKAIGTRCNIERLPAPVLHEHRRSLRSPHWAA